MNKKILKLVELMVDQRIKNLEKPAVEEDRNHYRTSSRLEVSRIANSLRDITDDLLMNTEMLIDESYGDVELEDFKKDYNNITNDFEKKFAIILKNMQK
tara:strand:- start:656 stop:952 length:297 start_codon:yes stop_codon:yes gene_type:complete